MLQNHVRSSLGQYLINISILMIALGISAYYHDSAAAIVRDGEIVAAVQEERFSRRKADSEFPGTAVTYCLDEAGVKLDQVDYAVF